MKWISNRWVDDSLLWYRTNSRIVDLRPQEDVDRLIELRVKQQPDVDWSVKDWDKAFIAIAPSKDDAFAAKKVILSGNIDDLGLYATKEVVEYEHHIWTSFRVKAVLRSGKMLPYSIMARLTAKSQWKSTERLIQAYGDLPGLSQEVLDAVQAVKNDGYQEALVRIMAGEISAHNTAPWLQEVRALDLVSKILNAWEAQDRKSGAGARDQQDRDLWDQGTLDR